MALLNQGAIHVVAVNVDPRQWTIVAALFERFEFDSPARQEGRKCFA